MVATSSKACRLKACLISAYIRQRDGLVEGRWMTAGNRISVRSKSTFGTHSIFFRLFAQQNRRDRSYTYSVSKSRFLHSTFSTYDRYLREHAIASPRSSSRRTEQLPASALISGSETRRVIVPTGCVLGCYHHRPLFSTPLPTTSPHLALPSSSRI